ncbi:cytochrome P450 4F6-like isoform X1 [Mizuhopecten yessoensis]|nr:cytochrome P450 4F6-like isoform X1 [Mizuhopecten yessoensis]XP_021354875.1 cytochrome P450 4F6-like isoform X1 [Mizuhopecten yessoensis]
MAGLIEIVLALVVGYGLWNVVPVLWRYYTFCQLIKPFKSSYKPHWFWGHLRYFTDTTSLSDTFATMMEKDTMKMSVNWIAFIPNLQAIHPDTAAIILKLSEPKPKGRGQPYSLFLPFIGEGLVVSSGQKWERNRKLLTPAFHFDVLRPYVNIYNDVADTLLDKFAKQMSESPNSIEITDHINKATLDVILRCSLSYEGNIQEQENHPYIEAIHEITRLTIERVRIPWHFLSWELFKRSANGRNYLKHVNYIHGFADEIIEKRRKALADDPSILQRKRKLDFLDILMTAKDEQGAGLTDMEIRDEVDTFMFGGHDTTKAALSWAIYNLGKYPEEQDKLFHEVCEVTGVRKNIEWEDLGKLQKMTMFLKENLRMYPPGLTTSRLLTKPLDIEGVTIPVGSLISVNMMAIHYRPDIFPNPTEFRPDRFLPENTENRHPYAFLPFSAGPRNCIGQNFSMNEQRVFLSRLLKRFKVVLDEDHEVYPIPTLISRPKNGIKVWFEER